MSAASCPGMWNWSSSTSHLPRAAMLDDDETDEVEELDGVLDDVLEELADLLELDELLDQGITVEDDDSLWLEDELLDEDHGMTVEDDDSLLLELEDELLDQGMTVDEDDSLLLLDELDDDDHWTT